jgi:ATP-dependent DNA helicase RecG
MTETELKQLLKTLIKQEESEFLEFKTNDKSDFGKYVSALSNGACLRNEDFGYLVFGINDKSKKIEGTSVKRSDLERIKTKISLEPKVSYWIYNFEIDSKPIILVKISAAKGEPTFYQGQSYARVGEDKTSLKNLSSAQIRKIYNSAVDWSSLVSETATISDLDELALKKAREKFKEKRENSSYLKEIDSWDNKIFLNKAGVMFNDKITNAALILLGKRESIQHLKNYSNAEISWRLETIEENAYEHFYPPFLLSTTELWKRIRNTKYKLFPTNELLSREVNKYDEETILEALYNCIAHQDYFLNSRIIVREKADKLIFENAGNFFLGKAEDYVTGEKIAHNHRNLCLTNAMVNFGMIDKIGFGIRKMFLGQRKKFFPLPDYNKSTKENVVLEIYGRVIDEKFSQVLMDKTDLELNTIIALDKVQKNNPLTDEEVILLKKQKLIEDRKPNYFITAEIASITGQKDKYLKNKAFSKQQYKMWILEYLKKFKEASRQDIDTILMNHLPDFLSIEAKKKKIENLLQEMSKKDQTIKNYGNSKSPQWRKLGIN